MASLTSEELYQGSIVTYVAIGALTAFIWDMFDNIPDDYILCMNSKWSNKPLLVYFLSRVGTLGFALSSVIFMTAPTGHCAFFSKLVHAWCPLSISLSALLFFFRVRAIYNGNKYIVAFFSFSWLFLLSASTSIPVGSYGTESGSTKFCKTLAPARYTYMGILCPLAYDTLVVLAISWRIYNSFGPLEEREPGRRLNILGKSLPSFSRSLIVDTQRYYLVTLIAGIVVAILSFHAAVPALLRPVSGVPYIVVVNLMACRVYRRTRLGYIRETQFSTHSHHVAESGGLYPMTFSPPSSASQIKSSTSQIKTAEVTLHLTEVDSNSRVGVC